MASTALAPRKITVDGVEIEPKHLSTLVVQQLLEERKDATPMENQRWLLSHTYYGDDDHLKEVMGAIPYVDLIDVFDEVLSWNKLSRAKPADETKPGEDQAAADS